MLLREKYDVLINVTLDCFDQRNFSISRINIMECNNIVDLFCANHLSVQSRSETNSS